MIREAQADDAAVLAALYNYFVEHTVTTFETDPIDAAEMAGRVAEVERLGLPWLVLEQRGTVCGYACAVRWKGRAAYSRSVESTIYLAQGLGVPLYDALLQQLAGLGVHCVLAGIALPNAASVGLHEKLGFDKVAHFAEVGRKFDHWIDVGYWQRLIA